jgi:biopolymer transport protein ExbD
MDFKRKSKISSEFSLASMSDMIFLLLIFFLITSTLVSPNGVKVVLPKNSANKPSPESVTVSITPDLKLYFTDGKQNEITSLDRLPSQLQTALSNNPNPVVGISADKSVPYENVMEVIKVATKLKYQILLKTERE